MTEKYTYWDLVDLLKKVYKTSKVESALGVEWANYPIEVFDEVVDVVTLLEFTEIEIEEGADKEDPELL